MSGAHLDHIILHTTDIDKAVNDFTAAGFTILTRNDAGPNHGTESRFLIFSGGTYILLMQFTNAAKKNSHRLARFLETETGFVDYGLRVPDVVGAAQRFGDLGLTPSAVGEYRSKLADGTPWGVKLFTVGRGAPAGCDALPFFVEDIEGATARIPSYKPHPNGVTRIVRLDLESENPEEEASFLRQAIEERGSGNVVNAGECELAFRARGAKARTSGRGGIISVVLAGAEDRSFVCQNCQFRILASH